MITLLLACAGGDDDATADPAPIVPVEGEWDVESGTEWSGDCRLDSYDNNYPPAAVWVFDVRNDVMMLYPDYWTPWICSLAEDGAFTCRDPYSEEYVDFSYHVVIEKLVVGTFTDARTFTGEHLITADCDGGGCGNLEEYWGEDFEWGCSVSAPVSGTASD